MSRRGGDDAGVTLAEVLVASGILLVVLLTVTAGIVQVSRATRTIEGAADAQGSTRRAFARLETEVRYAADVDPSATAAGHPAVTLLLSNAAVGRCLQLRLAGTRLERRAWPLGAPQAAWELVAAPVSAPADAPAFTRYDIDAAHLYQRLRVRVLARLVDEGAVVSRLADTTFVALNSANRGAGRAADCRAEAR
ncbi:hypothetical protein GCM10010124_32910 [Pilimelia terevasa]|uniref:Prepilin-type N-terminal cleavage/methylation domain-containing protein n=1 Tax=Pilimelia terevasa TaxID=53372 RepID=A0A8J3BPL8_9ACTN|nr:hypothetical protein [Pilimelia terevasa]GGK37531.1 hypothetical protein GCM10010124_32910 [Pilimelia terevasa]